MRTLFGLTVPLLLLLAAFTTAVPQAVAQEATYTISGRVVSDAGDPIEGARVNAYTYPEGDRRMMDDGATRHDETVTDANGEFTLELAEGRGWINVYYEKWRASDGRELLVEADTRVDFTLVTPPPKDAILEGRVLDGNGDPIEGAEVSLQGRCCYAMPAETAPSPPEATPVDGGANEGNATAASGSGSSSVASPAIAPAPPPYYYDDYATTVTDADGRFRFEAYEGPRQVTAWAKGYAQTTVPVEAVSGRTTSVEVVLEKVPASDAVVVGRVIDASTGLPLAGAQVNLRSLEWGRYAWAETGSDGSFRITTVPGWAEISVNHYPRGPEPMPLADDVATKPMIVAPRGPMYYPHTQLVDLRSGENTVNAPLDPKPTPTVALIGYVVDPDSKQAVSGARVSVWNHENGDWGEALTDATGSYKVMVRPGHYSASASKEGYLGGSQSFRVGDGPTERVDLVLPRGTPKWAPCYEGDDGCGPIMYSRGEAVPVAAPTQPTAAAPQKEAATTTDAPAPAPAMTPTAGGMATRDESNAGTFDGDRGGAPSFEGSGGGLPPYDPEAGAQPATAEEGATSAAPVPAGGALLAVLALAAAILLARRR